MTSINININSLEEKKDMRGIKVKYDGKQKDEYAGEHPNYRAEKKRKIREKAAALLNRVKSQDYMRSYDSYGREPAYHYYEERGPEEYQDYYGRGFGR